MISFIVSTLFSFLGVLTFVWLVFWFLFTSDNPQSNRYISDVERNYIISQIEYDTEARVSSTALSF